MGTLGEGGRTSSNVTLPEGESQPAPGDEKVWKLVELEGFEVGDDVVFFLIAEDAFIGRHAVSTGIDDGADIGFIDRLTIGKLLVFEKAFEPGAHFLFGAVGVVADAALFEGFFTLGGVTLGRVAFLKAGQQISRQQGGHDTNGSDHFHHGKPVSPVMANSRVFILHENVKQA